MWEIYNVKEKFSIEIYFKTFYSWYAKLIFLFIINVENSCATYYFCGNHHPFFKDLRQAPVTCTALYTPCHFK